MPKAELEKSVVDFISLIKLPQEQIDMIVDKVSEMWDIHEAELASELSVYDTKTEQLKLEAEQTVRKMRLLQSDVAIRYMEEDLVRIERELETINSEKAIAVAKKPMDFDVVLKRTKYFLEHMDELLIQQIDSVKKAQLFGVLFDQTPKYSEINSGNQNSLHLTGVNQLFQLAKPNKLPMVISPGIEPGLPG